MKVKTITINYQTFILPEAMSNKDVQLLGGFLLALRETTSLRTEDYRQEFCYPGDSARVQLGQAELFETRAQAEVARDAAQAEAKAKAEAEAAAQ
jgi:hypothetical protein